MPHTNETLLRTAYAGFASGDLAPMASLIGDYTTWSVTGGSPVSGTYTGRDEIFGFFGKVMDLYEGTFRIEVRDVLANDRYGVVLATERGITFGELLKFTSVHLWVFNEGRCDRFMSYEDDAYHRFWAQDTLGQLAGS